MSEEKKKKLPPDKKRQIEKILDEAVKEAVAQYGPALMGPFNQIVMKQLPEIDANPEQRRIVAGWYKTKLRRALRYKM
jgi:hypothetical protein